MAVVLEKAVQRSEGGCPEWLVPISEVRVKGEEDRGGEQTSRRRRRIFQS